MDDEGHPISIVFELEDILFNILKNLSAKVLDQVARVNVTWNRVAKKIKQTRKHFWFSYLNAEEPGYFENPSDVFEYVWMIGPELGVSVQNLASDPHFVLVFGSLNLKDVKVSVPSVSSLSGVRTLPRGVKREKTSFPSYLERTLPASCHMIGVVTSPIIATRLYFDIKIFVQHGISASCLFFPKFDGVDIYRFCLEDNFGDGLTKDSFSAKTGIPVEKSPKLILLFWRDSRDFAPHTFVSKILNICGDVVIAGSQVNSLFTDRALNLQNQNQLYAYGFRRLGIAFCGGSDLRVSSVVIKAGKRRKEQVEAELSRLKAVHIPDKCSVAFLIYSGTRLTDQFFAGQIDVEAEAFRKLFPDVPLFGFFGEAEIGFDHLPGNAHVKAAVDYSKIKYSHKGTAIFVILYFP